MKHALPTIPTGHDFIPGSFWYTYRAKFTRVHTPNLAAEQWYEREKRKAELSGAVFPPEPKFCKVQPARPVPQPWDGKNEKPGRVPKQ